MVGWAVCIARNILVEDCGMNECSWKKKAVRKICHDDAKWTELAYDMVPRRTFVRGVMNFVASNGWMAYSHSQRCVIFKGENGTGWSVVHNSGTTR